MANSANFFSPLLGRNPGPCHLPETSSFRVKFCDESYFPHQRTFYLVILEKIEGFYACLTSFWQAGSRHLEFRDGEFQTLAKGNGGFQQVLDGFWPSDREIRCNTYPPVSLSRNNENILGKKCWKTAFLKQILTGFMRERIPTSIMIICVNFGPSRQPIKLRGFDTWPLSLVLENASTNQNWRIVGAHIWLLVSHAPPIRAIEINVPLWQITATVWPSVGTLLDADHWLVDRYRVIVTK